MLEFAVSELSQDVNIPVQEEKDRFDSLFDWMKSHGAEFEKLKMRYYAPDYRGVHAAREIKKGETIVYVPIQEIITLEMAMTSPIGAQMAERNFRNRLISPKHSFLSTYIMQERRKSSSFYDKYIDILPKAFDNFPIFYTQEERAWLKGSPFQNQISEKIKDIQADYNMIVDEVPDYREFPLKEYSEMRMMVASRIFGIQVNGLKTDGFVPYADMLNHRRPRQTAWSYSDERGGFIIESLEDIKRGDQVYDSYGKKCNTRFLLNYGFINLDNDANEYPLKVILEEDDKYATQKAEMLGLNSIKRTFRVQAHMQEPIMEKFLSFLRFVEFDENIALMYQIKAQWEQRRRPHNNLDSDDSEPSQQFEATEIPFISKRNEGLAWKKIKKMCEAGMSEYPTTKEEDEEILKREDLTFNQRNCVLFRHGEKEILTFLIDMADLMEKILDMKFKDAKKVVSSLSDYYNEAKDYLNEVLKLIA